MKFAKYKCKLCGDVIQSEYDGHLKRCKCGKIAVDQSEFYTRLIGEPENIEVVDNESIQQEEKA